jgi:metal-responsive CopG/Arc/MetJ family transcriptional regulator
MKLKTSLTLSEDILVAVDRIVGPTASRSAFIESVLRDFFDRKREERRREREVQRINKQATRLNTEMAEVLEFQDA